MIKRYPYWLLCLVFISLGANPIFAQTNTAAISIHGRVETPEVLSAAQLQTLPRTKLTTTTKNGDEVTFEGVLLFDIVNHAKPKFSDKCCDNEINTVAILKASDGYQVTFSLPEFDPKFTKQKVLLADRANGKPLAAEQGPFQLIVPEEKVHARWIHHVTEIEISSAGEAKSSTNSLPR